MSLCHSLSSGVFSPLFLPFDLVDILPSTLRGALLVGCANVFSVGPFNSRLDFARWSDCSFFPSWLDLNFCHCSHILYVGSNLVHFSSLDVFFWTVFAKLYSVEKKKAWKNCPLLETKNSLALVSSSKARTGGTLYLVFFSSFAWTELSADAVTSRRVALKPPELPWNCYQRCRANAVQFFVSFRHREIRRKTLSECVASIVNGQACVRISVSYLPLSSIIGHAEQCEPHCWSLYGWNPQVPNEP